MIAKEVGDRAGKGTAYANLGTCHMHLNEYDKAVAHFEAQHDIGNIAELAHMQSYAALNMGVALMQSYAALNMGVALTLHVQAGRRGPAATGADQALDRIVTRQHRRA